MQKNLIIIALALVLAVGLGLAFVPASQSLPAAEYAAWVNNPENGLKQGASTGSIQLTALYKPLDFIVLQEADVAVLSNQEALNTRKQALSELQYYEVQVASHIGTDATFQQFLGTLQEQISLLDGSDSLACVLYHHEPSMGVKPHETLLLGFFRTNSKNDKTLLIDLSQLGQGVTALHFEASALANLPKLSTL